MASDLTPYFRGERDFPEHIRTAPDEDYPDERLTMTIYGFSLGTFDGQEVFLVVGDDSKPALLALDVTTGERTTAAGVIEQF